MSTWIRCLLMVGLTSWSWVESLAGDRVWEEGILVLVGSDVFDGFLFEHDDQTLTVYFRCGEITEYRDVSCEVYQALMSAPDRAGWFARNVHRAFPCRRIASAFRPSRKPGSKATTKEDSHAVSQSSHTRR